MNNQTLKIKVCGMREPQNIEQLVALHPDYIGFIFYPKSKRFVNNGSSKIPVGNIPVSIKKTGVFVNAGISEIRETIDEFQLNAVQLHGNETPEFCFECKHTGVEVVKAFPIAKSEDFEATNDYAAVCDYFLFDTKTDQYGGSGQKFDWNILDSYSGETPFFLSGGIDVDDAPAIKKLNYPLLYAVDINSRFEDAPALKNIPKLTKFIQQIR